MPLKPKLLLALAVVVTVAVVAGDYVLWLWVDAALPQTPKADIKLNLG